ncbi:NEL-type E3 ubiquitin ligase domain-containing protein [Pseudomonas alkylphenolica]|uniref:NEL-type E3 ubiquitin ligase domain-containing protein n=1 Tax=Pseudomonas alkylphenolica TaxID=237609 RepID=UPI0018D6B6E3|nr:NEL-type E3 ubiquitin ligase domain-containing protein [Pseudomonas alkylphenolica]MBH3428125.1 hypothetical protein [Pseudomonas alkylphenolica]
METLPKPAPATQDTLDLEQSFQDHFIAGRLPTWLRSATPEHMAKLGPALRQSLQIRQRIHTVLERIEGIDGFALGRLEQALEQHLNETFNVQRWTFIAGHREPVINAQPVGAHLTEVVYADVPLLEAALRNFTAEEATAQGQPRGNRLSSSRLGQVKPPSAVEFAGICRTLDLGGQYQQHLDNVLLSPTPDGQSVAALLGDSHRHGMLVDAYKARLNNVLSEDELQLIVGLCADGKPPRLQDKPVVAKQLRLLGCNLEQIVVLDVIDEGLLRNTSARVLVHVPGDPNGAWSAFTSLQRLANELGRRLRTDSYQRFFSRFVRRRDSQQFFSVVIPAYKDLAIWANYTLDEHLRAYSGPLFDTLGQARIEQIKDDAAMIAVPVSDLDRAVQQAHDQRLKAEGWALLNLAGFFVPVIGAALLAVTAWELLGEVYHGVEAWHDGDTNEALDHLAQVATDLAIMGVTAVGIGVAQRLWTRSTWVDSLVPAQMNDGTTRLCSPAWEAFRSAPPAPEAIVDEAGIHRLGDDQAWVEMDGHYYPVVQRASDSRWQLRPRAGVGPRLCHNGAGAWRLWYEQPAQWRDSHYLFRRLGGRFRELDDEQIDQVLLAHGMQADQLRALHVEGRAPAAALADSVLRFRLDQRIRTVISALRSGVRSDDGIVLQHARSLPAARELSDQDLAELTWRNRRLVFQRVYDAQQASATPHTTALRRNFPSLHEPAARELLRAAAVADRQQLMERARVPLRLGEAARVQSSRIRQARVFEAFYLDTPQNADLARVALAMLEHLPGGATMRWRLFEGGSGGPQLLVVGAGSRQVDLVHLAGRFQRLDAQGRAQGDAGELFDVLASAHDDHQRNAIGVSEPFAHNLRVLLGRQAVNRREQVAQLLGGHRARGWFRAPQRLIDGRVGYPLSGRGAAGGGPRPLALFAMIRELYPSFTDTQVLAWLNDVRHAQLDVNTEITRLGNELASLDSHLQQWSAQVTRADVREERDYFMRCLIDCWRHRTTTGPAGAEGVQNYRFAMFAAAPGVLPTLPADVSFGHVSELALMGMELQDIPTSFLRAFSNIRILELNGNRLARVPSGLSQLEHLRELDMFNNRIVLDADQARLLSQSESLEYLNLSFNPLGRGFSLVALTRLRRLHLRNTHLTELPAGVLDASELMLVDLRDNRISALPRRFHRAPIWTRRMILLWGNPLNAQDAQRLQAAVPPLGEVVAEGSISARQRWLDAVNSLARDELSSVWEVMEMEPRSDDFFQLLGRLLDTADFRRRSEALADRVFTLLQWMREHASLREEIFSQVTQQLTCQDSVALCFSNLELRMLVWRARLDAVAGDQQGALLHLGRQLWRLDQVDRIALEDIQARRAAGSNPDEIEVGLAYRVALRDALDLPAQPGDMLFAEVAGVDEARIERARNQVLNTETTEQLAASLVQREFWQEHLQRTEQARLEVVDAPFHERLNALLEEAESVPEVEYLVRVNAVNDERQVARQALLLQLTREALTQDPV